LSIDNARTAAGSSSISVAEYNALRAGQMTEQQLQQIVTVTANRYGWLAYHTHDSRRSQAGYPDLHLVHVGRKLSIFRELKTMKGKTTAAQNEWLAALTVAGHDAAVWRPLDWFDNTISETLFPSGVTS